MVQYYGPKQAVKASSKSGTTFTEVGSPYLVSRSVRISLYARI